MKSVTVVTRTKDRPVLLNRTLSDISSQTFKDFVWVVVNDGGDPSLVDAIAASFSKSKGDVVVIHHAQSQGPGAAANLGIRQSQSEFIVLHDDDDTWDPSFLEKTVHFLRTNGHFGGVVTYMNDVREKMVGDTCITVSTQPHYHRYLKAISLADMCRSCLFNPISFLFRRDCYDKVKGYDTEFPGGEDWAFVLKLLLQDDIGLIPELLANYHHRVESPRDGYDNTTGSGQRKHLEEFDALVRHHFLRDDLRSGKLGLGFLTHAGKWAQGIELEFEKSHNKNQPPTFIDSLARKLGLKDA